MTTDAAPARRPILSEKAQFLATTLGTQVLRVLTTLVLARLLTPTDYGLVTLVVSVPSTVSALGDLGVMRALVQIRDEPIESLEDTGLVLTALINLIYLLLSIGGGFVLAYLLHDRRMIWLGLILGFTSYVSSIYDFQMTLLNRALRFRAESFQNIIAAVAMSISGIAMAWAGLGVYTLALQPLAAQIVANAAMARHFRLGYPRHFRPKLAGRMLNYGWRVTLAQYANNERDTFINLVVGAVFKAAALGIFNKAAQVKDMVGHNIASAFDRLLYPLMSASAEDRRRAASLFLRGCVCIAVVCWFGWAWFTATAWDLVYVVLGKQWTDVPPLLIVMAIDLIPTFMATMATVCAHVVGEPLRWMRWTVASAVVLCPAVLIAARWNMLAVALVAVVAQGIFSIGFFAWAMRRMEVSWAALLARLAPLAAAAALSFLAMHELSVGPLAAWGRLARLTMASAVGGCVYAGILVLLDRNTVRELRQVILGG